MIPHMRKILAAIGLTVMAQAASAAYPERPIRLVSIASPGGSIDVIFRLLEKPLSELLGQPIVIDHKTGAGGMIGLNEVARSEPDGYTIGVALNSMAVTAMVQSDAKPVDISQNFAMISTVAQGPMMLYAHPSVPGNTVSDLIAYAKSQPNEIPFASTGLGGLGHLCVELLSDMSDTPFLHIPYKGNNPSLMAVMNKDALFTITSFSHSAIENAKVGKMKLLGVTTKEASPLVPGTPPISDVYPEYDISVWLGLLAPKGTPEPIVEQLNKAIRQVLAQPELASVFHSNGMEPVSSTPDEMRARFAKELETWKPFIEKGATTRS